MGVKRLAGNRGDLGLGDQGIWVIREKNIYLFFVLDPRISGFLSPGFPDYRINDFKMDIISV